jgi:hypothetical protein
MPDSSRWAAAPRPVLKRIILLAERTVPPLCPHPPAAPAGFAANTLYLPGGPYLPRARPAPLASRECPGDHKSVTRADYCPFYNFYPFYAPARACRQCHETRFPAPPSVMEAWIHDLARSRAGPARSASAPADHVHPEIPAAEPAGQPDQCASEPVITGSDVHQAGREAGAARRTLCWLPRSLPGALQAPPSLVAPSSLLGPGGAGALRSRGPHLANSIRLGNGKDFLRFCYFRGFR